MFLSVGFARQTATRWVFFSAVASMAFYSVGNSFVIRRRANRPIKFLVSETLNYRSNAPLRARFNSFRRPPRQKVAIRRFEASSATERRKVEPRCESVSPSLIDQFAAFVRREPGKNRPNAGSQFDDTLFASAVFITEFIKKGLLNSSNFVLLFAIIKPMRAPSAPETDLLWQNNRRFWRLLVNPDQRRLSRLILSRVSTWSSCGLQLNASAIAASVCRFLPAWKSGFSLSRDWYRLPAASQIIQSPGLLVCFFSYS